MFAYTGFLRMNHLPYAPFRKPQGSPHFRVLTSRKGPRALLMRFRTPLGRCLDSLEDLLVFGSWTNQTTSLHPSDRTWHHLEESKPLICDLMVLPWLFLLQCSHEPEGSMKYVGAFKEERRLTTVIMQPMQANCAQRGPGQASKPLEVTSTLRLLSGISFLCFFGFWAPF